MEKRWKGRVRQRERRSDCEGTESGNWDGKNGGTGKTEKPYLRYVTGRFTDRGCR